MSDDRDFEADVRERVRQHSERLIATAPPPEVTRVRLMPRRSIHARATDWRLMAVGVSTALIVVFVARFVVPAPLNFGHPAGTDAVAAAVGSPSISAPPASSATSALTPTSTPSASTSFRACDPATLTAVGGREGVTGVARISISFTNNGTDPCVLPGVPAKVSLVRANGTALALKAATPLGDPTARVVVHPGVKDDAWLTVYWMNWCGRDPGPLTIRVTFTAGGGTVGVPLRGPYVARCDTPGLGSSIQVEGVSQG